MSQLTQLYASNATIYNYLFRRGVLLYSWSYSQTGGVHAKAHTTSAGTLVSTGYLLLVARPLTIG